MVEVVAAVFIVAFYGGEWSSRVNPSVVAALLTVMAVVVVATIVLVGRRK
jgi:hypothetical protein